MNPVMYLIVDSTLKMSRGKEDAQVAHAAVEAYRLSEDDLISAWDVGGHYTKIVLQADSLYVARSYIEARGFSTEMIIDEGRTEFDGRLTPTVLGCAIVDKDDEHVKATFSAFKLRKEPPAEPQVLIERYARPATLEPLRGRTLSLEEAIPYLDSDSLLIVRRAMAAASVPSKAVPTPPPYVKTLFGYPLSAQPGTPQQWVDITDCIKHRDGYAAIGTDEFLDRVSEHQAREGR